MSLSRRLSLGTLALAALSPLVAQSRPGTGPQPAIGVLPPPHAGALLTLAEVSRLGFSVQGAGARSTGMGGAFIAVADDGTAASHNPAGLAQLRTFEASLVGSSQTPRMDYTDMTSVAGAGNRSSTNTYGGSASRKVEFVSFAAPLSLGGRNLVVQASWQNLFDLDLAMDHRRSIVYGGAGTSSELKEGIHQSGRMGLVTGAVAYEFSPRILAGVSYNRWSGRWTYRSDYDLTLVMPAGTAQELGAVQTGSSFEGQNWNLGLLWRTEAVKLGFTYRTPFTAAFSVDGGLYPVNTTPSLATPEQARIHWPWTLGLGAAWRPAPPFQVALDWSRTPWSRTTFDAPGSALNHRNFFNPFAPLGTGGQILQSADATTWRLGAEYLHFWGNRIVPVRVGFFREPQPVRDDRTGEQRVLKGFTLGVGLKQGALAFDLAFKRAKGDRAASVPEDPFTGFAALAAGGYSDYYSWTGHETVTLTQIKASIIYQFKGEGLRAFLHSVFIGD